MILFHDTSCPSNINSTASVMLANNVLNEAIIEEMTLTEILSLEDAVIFIEGKK